MSENFLGSDVYVAIPERGQQVMPLMAGDLADVRVLARERLAMFATAPGGPIHPIHDYLDVVKDHPEWPSLMFRATFVDDTVIRIIEELPDWSLFGPRGKAIEDLIDQYLFLDDIGKESFHQAEHAGRLALRNYADESGEGVEFIETVFDGTVFHGKYALACKALYYLANSASVSGPLALAAAIILRDGLGEEAYEHLVEPYRTADIPFLEIVE